jgi:hypothetical protein
VNSFDCPALVPGRTLATFFTSGVVAILVSFLFNAYCSFV